MRTTRRSFPGEPVVKLKDLDLDYFSERGTIDRDALLGKGESEF